MTKMDFTSEDISQLRDVANLHEHQYVRRKASVLLLKAHGIPQNKIQQIVDVTGNTIRRYIEDYKQGGIEEIQHLNFYSPSSELEAHTALIRDYFDKNPPTTIAEAKYKIKELTGIERGNTQVRAFMIKIGFKRLYAGNLPSKADPAKQTEFLDNQLEPKLEEARQNQRTVFFVDAAHFVFGAFLTYFWCRARKFIKTSAGRQRYNVLGALDAVTHELITVTNLTYINAQSVCELLQKIADQKIVGPITVVLDNAKYQRCDLVIKYAENLNIELLFLPTYSPNLNLIERLWKFMKKECLRGKYHENFPAFQNAIDTCIESLDSKYSSELASLLTHNFQSFAECQTA